VELELRMGLEGGQDRNNCVREQLAEYLRGVEERIQPTFDELRLARVQKVRDNSPLLSPQTTPRFPSTSPQAWEKQSLPKLTPPSSVDTVPDVTWSTFSRWRSPVEARPLPPALEYPDEGFARGQAEPFGCILGEELHGYLGGPPERWAGHARQPVLRSGPGSSNSLEDFELDAVSHDSTAE
jgi:hypothetical protein